MQIQIRAAMAQDYEAAVKILSQVQDMHVEGPSHTTRDLIFVDRMAVDEAYRGAGVGHKMFDFLKGLKAEKNMDAIELQVNAKNTAAYEMYRKYGFTEKSINLELLEP